MWCCSEIVVLCPEIADLDQVELVVESKWFTRFSGNSIAQATECDDREQATLAWVNSMPRPTRASVKTWCIVYGHPSHSPDAPCMAYLPTFTPKMTQFCRKIFHTWSIWDSAMDVFFCTKTTYSPSSPPVSFHPVSSRKRSVEPLAKVSVVKRTPAAWLQLVAYGDGSKPWYLVNPKIAGKWMFIPLEMVLIGIDP